MVNTMFLALSARPILQALQGSMDLWTCGRFLRASSSPLGHGGQTIEDKQPLPTGSIAGGENKTKVISLKP